MGSGSAASGAATAFATSRAATLGPFSKKFTFASISIAEEQRDDARAGAVARAYRRLSRVQEHGRSVNAQEKRELFLGRVNGRKRVRAPISRLWKHAWTHQPDDGQQSEGSDARGRRAQEQ
jgi:nuclear transport factor 2 (NTF2) superfamily protein